MHKAPSLVMASVIPPKSKAEATADKLIRVLFWKGQFSHQLGADKVLLVSPKKFFCNFPLSRERG